MTTSLVTGTSTGIGAAVALRLAREGHTVRATVRSPESGAALLEAADGLDLSLVIMDVDDDDSVAEAIAGVLDDTGPVDVLVNNAGIAGGGSIEHTPMADFRRVMNTNAWGPLRCIQAVLPAMREQESGHIVTVTSLAGRLAFASQGAYAMSKWAAEALSELVAVEGAPYGIRSTAVEPGVVLTPIFEKAMADPPERDPHHRGSDRLNEWFLQSLMSDPTSSEAVADVVWEALTADDPKVRYLVGDDAERIWAHRTQLSDEAWVGHQAEPDISVWRRWMTEASGVPMPEA